MYRQVLARDPRVMDGVLHIERCGAMGRTSPSDSKSQGKNARQFHPQRSPLNSGLRAMRLRVATHFDLNSNPFSHTHWPQYVSNVTRRVHTHHGWGKEQQWLQEPSPISEFRELL